jgi:hypothetical protein
LKKAKAAKRSDDLRPQYDLSELGPTVRGKYYRQAVSGSNLILIEPELARVFPDSESVNRALRLLMKTAEASAAPRRQRTVLGLRSRQAREALSIGAVDTRSFTSTAQAVRADAQDVQEHGQTQLRAPPGRDEDAGDVSFQAISAASGAGALL